MPIFRSVLLNFVLFCVRCAQQINNARKNLAALLDPLPIGGGPRQLREVITQAVRDIDAKIASEFEGLLLAHMTILKHRISEIKHIPPLTKLLEDGFASRREAMASNLEAVRWDISSQDTLHAVTREVPIENVSFIQDRPLYQHVDEGRHILCM